MCIRTSGMTSTPLQRLHSPHALSSSARVSPESSHNATSLHTRVAKWLCPLSSQHLLAQDPRFEHQPCHDRLHITGSGFASRQIYVQFVEVAFLLSRVSCDVWCTGSRLGTLGFSTRQTLLWDVDETENHELRARAGLGK
jgi:hypothetical protein